MDACCGGNILPEPRSEKSAGVTKGKRMKRLSGGGGSRGEGLGAGEPSPVTESSVCDKGQGTVEAKR